jgi:hypothetical protein
LSRKDRQRLARLVDERLLREAGEQAELVALDGRLANLLGLRARPYLLRRLLRGVADGGEVEAELHLAVGADVEFVQPDAARQMLWRRLLFAEARGHESQNLLAVHDRRTSAFHLDELADHLLKLGHILLFDPQLVVGLRRPATERLEVHRRRADLLRPAHDLRQLAEVRRHDGRLDDDRKGDALLFLLRLQEADAAHDPVEQPLHAAHVVVHLRFGRVERDVEVERTRGHERLHVLFVQQRAVGRHARQNVVVAAEAQEVDKSFFDKGFAAAEVDREAPGELLDAEQGFLPLLDGHLRNVLRLPPVFAVAALAVAALVDESVEGDGAGEIDAVVDVERLGERVARMVQAHAGQFGDFHFCRGL